MEPLLRLNHISKSFTLKGTQKVAALQDVSLEVYKGETLGIVGESGCGKSTLARSIMGIYPGVKGEIYFKGSLLDLKSRKNRLAFAEKVQMIFQDPYSSLNPRMTVGDIVAENLVIQRQLDKHEQMQRVYEILAAVGLQSGCAARYPHEFSGGQRQRIGIARALAVNPELLICDEPISALDVSIQSQIMNLLKQLKSDLALTYIFIAHDLNMVHYIADRVAVMYQGHILELAPAETIYETPGHPYTKLLLEAVLRPEPGEESNVSEDIYQNTGALNAGQKRGCPYYERCPLRNARCEMEKAELKEASKGHFVACHYVLESRYKH